MLPGLGDIFTMTSACCGLLRLKLNSLPHYRGRERNNGITVER